VILSANAGSKNIEVLFDVDPLLPRHLVGDAMRLMQVLINLGGNAIKFTEHGEVVVAVAVVSRTEAGVRVNIGVRDSGIGIAPENQARIFSGFTQAEASTTRRFGGTGLGLAISQRMGGELRLDSALGRGSRFHFEIELPLAADAVEEPADDQPASTRARLRALVVDDNPMAREVLERMVESLGWAVDVVESGQQALARLQSQPGAFDAVFVDWLMPGMDGWQTCEQIRALSLVGGAPLVVMVTAHGRELLAQRSAAEQALIDGFLVKPVTASMLYDAIVDARAERSGTPMPRKGPAASLRRLQGLRLLVTEDNANNQQVARELLEDEGAEVLIANNGLEAVEAVAAAEPPFDVVLMDLQMPVMDGYTATRRIRQDLGRLDLPIVAMTANAMASDREACLAAGMNDHVGKPFDLDHLVKVLRRLAGRAGPERLAQALAPLPSDLAPEVVAAAAAAGVDLASALRRLGGKVGVYRRSLGGFLKELSTIDAALAEPAIAGRMAATARELHTLKGVAATLGITRLASAAADGERRLNSDPTPGQAAAALGEVRTTIAALRTALESLCDTIDEKLLSHEERLSERVTASGTAPQDPADRVELLEALASLQHMLAESDMGAIEALASLRARFPHAAGPSLEALDQAVDDLDFDVAQRHCRDWLTAGQAQGDCS
jgi:CheY-like chemotaxis protein